MAGVSFPVKKLFVHVIHNKSALRRKVTGEQDKEKESNETVLFQVIFSAAA